ncbi:MAG: gliding motility protein, partial [Myxococcota bacterium]
MRTLMALGVLVLLLAGAAGGAGFWYTRALAARGPDGPAVEIEVPKGASASRVGNLLVEHGLIRDPVVMELWLRIQPPPSSPKAGRHRV